MAEDVSIHLKGLKEFQGALREVDRKLGPELRKTLNQVAEVVASAARPLVPVQSGKAVGSIKAGSTQRAAQIKAGGAKVPYYQWLDFGGHVGRNKSIARPFYTIGRYLYPTAKEKRPETERKLDEVLRQLATSAGFDTKGDSAHE